MATKVYESMTAWQGARWKVRVWATEPVMNAGPNAAVLTALTAVDDLADRLAFAEALDAVPVVAAYEILDFDGNGVVVYTDWP